MLAAIHGMKVLPAELVGQLQDRIKSERMGRVTLTPPVDETISGMTRRTVAIGGKMIAAAGGKPIGDGWLIRTQSPVEQPAQSFKLADLMNYWNDRWSLVRAGFGGDPSGAMRGIRGITGLDGDVLITYPRDESRGVVLRRTVQLGDSPALSVDVAAEPGRAWELLVYAGNSRIHRQIIASDGNEPEWQPIRLDLKSKAGGETVIRLYQRTLLPGEQRLPGNAYWRSLRID